MPQIPSQNSSRAIERAEFAIKYNGSRLMHLVPDDRVTILDDGIPIVIIDPLLASIIILDVVTEWEKENGRKVTD
jgi:hypothetical protein